MENELLEFALSIAQLMFYILATIGLFITFSNYAYNIVFENIFGQSKNMIGSYNGFITLTYLIIMSIYFYGAMYYNFNLTIILISTLSLLIWSTTVNRLEKYLLKKDFVKVKCIIIFLKFATIFSYSFLMFIFILLTHNIMNQVSAFTYKFITSLTINYFVALVTFTLIIQGNLAYKNIINSREIKYTFNNPKTILYGYLLDEKDSYNFILTKDFQIKKIYFSNLASCEFQNNLLLDYIKKSYKN